MLTPRGLGSLLIPKVYSPCQQLFGACETAVGGAVGNSLRCTQAGPRHLALPKKKKEKMCGMLRGPVL